MREWFKCLRKWWLCRVNAHLIEIAEHNIKQSLNWITYYKNYSSKISEDLGTTREAHDYKIRIAQLMDREEDYLKELKIYLKKLKGE